MDGSEVGKRTGGVRGSMGWLGRVTKFDGVDLIRGAVASSSLCGILELRAFSRSLAVLRRESLS